jgi:hypothetical protein
LAGGRVKSAPLAVWRRRNYKNTSIQATSVGGDDPIAGRYDFGLALNREERAFAETLDDAEFIAWWRCNPDRKP